ncbi:MAG: TrkH family potassium uptake protein [Lachnospiraceae bacterium]|mgnify:FL=1|nr:TrkH family potassium uptake protein [Lachnospiraceae bacterium]
MNYRMMGKFISRILLVEAVFMIPALLISIFHEETAAVHGFLTGMVITVATASLLYLICRKAKKGFYAREGLVCVGASWVVMSLLGCLPFYFSREIPSFVDALFETVSGFTTTGASILPEVEPLSMGNLYWRSFTHWLGGMGVLVFVLAIGRGREKSDGYTMHLLRAESPGPKVEKLVPKMKDSAKILYFIYVFLTILNVVFLLIGGMPLFDSLCTAFGTAGTGGFGIKNDSIAGYSPYLQNVCTVFMLLFGVNFSCYYMLAIRQVKNVFKDEELRFYLGTALASVVLIAWNVRGLYGTIGETFRHAAFQVASIMTTTGFATADFDLWPSFSRAILLGLMIVGACAGSTGGGFKCGRTLLLIKSLRRNVRQILHPQKVQVVRVNGQMVTEKVLDNTNAYLAAYAFIIVFSFIVISIDGFSPMTNFSAVLACFNNIGPGLESVGPTCNFGDYGLLSKSLLIVDMLAGRLEIFPILILFSRSTWTGR